MDRTRGSGRRLLGAALAAVMALSLAGCRGGAGGISEPGEAVSVSAVLGEGARVLLISVTEPRGETVFEVRTDERTVGAALREVGLIAGEEGPFGLYIKTVNGLTVDYDKDKAYWAFYVDGRLAPRGVDQTDIQPGVKYALKVETP